MLRKLYDWPVVLNTNPVGSIDTFVVTIDAAPAVALFANTNTGLANPVALTELTKSLVELAKLVSLLIVVVRGATIDDACNVPMTITITYASNAIPNISVKNACTEVRPNTPRLFLIPDVGDLSNDFIGFQRNPLKLRSCSTARAT